MQDDVKRLTNNIFEIAKVLHRKSYHPMKKDRLYPGQPKLLTLIKANEGIPQKELSKKNYVKPSTITGMLNKLEANQYVYRVPDTEDKRIMRVYLTPQGRQLADQSEQYYNKLSKQLFYGFTPDDMQTLIFLTDKMKNNLHQKVD